MSDGVQHGGTHTSQRNDLSWIACSPALLAVMSAMDLEGYRTCDEAPRQPGGFLSPEEMVSHFHGVPLAISASWDQYLTEGGDVSKTFTDEELARVCHEANRALQNILMDTCPTAPWDAASQDMKQTAIRGVQFARQGRTAEEQHERWRQHKLAMGWQIGPVRNEENRVHPNLVPYNHLPEGEQLKDKLFLAIVEVLGNRS